MTKNNNGWGELFAGPNGLRVTVFAGGVALQAIEVFIGSTLLPSIVADIGGLELFAWNATVFIVASIAASIFATIRPFGIGPRGNYMLAAIAFCIGSLICGASPNMEVMLVGRAVQGFGAGLLVAMTYAMIRLVFAEHLWPRAMALISSVWGVATLIGPAIGGIFAEFDAWRWAFYVLVPLSILLGGLAGRVVPKHSSEAGMQRLPLPQIGLLMGAVAAISIASVLTANLVLSLGLIVAALIAIASLGFIERSTSVRLLPTGTFSLASPLAALFALLSLLQLAITSDIFAPLFLQRLHGMPPLAAGYLVALVAIGWSSSSIVTSGWTGTRARNLIVVGPAILALGAAGLTVFLPSQPGGTWLTIVLISLSLFALGVGIGTAWQQINTRVLHNAPAGEGDVTSAAISMAQQVSTGLGAAFAGVIVNMAGLSSGNAQGAVDAAQWLYGLFMLAPVVAIPIGWIVVRREANDTHEPVEVPAE